MAKVDLNIYVNIFVFKDYADHKWYIRLSCSDGTFTGIRPGFNKRVQAMRVVQALFHTYRVTNGVVPTVFITYRHGKPAVKLTDKALNHLVWSGRLRG